MTVDPPAAGPNPAVHVAPGVRRVRAPNPGMMTGTGTNTYLVGEDRVAVIDPGPDDDAHLAALLSAGGERIRWVVATHTHLDHSPLCRRLAEVTGAEIVGFGPAPPAAAGPTGVDAHDHEFQPSIRLADGDRLDGGDFVLRAVHTPGHASNHLCFELDGTGLLFTGDHVMSGSTVVIAPPDGDMTRYLASLERVRSPSLRRIAPGHGEMIDDPDAVLAGYLDHRRARERQILDGVTAAGPSGTTVTSLVDAIYGPAGVSAELQKVARFSVWAHLQKLAADGPVERPDGDPLTGAWRRRGQAGSSTGSPLFPEGR